MRIASFLVGALALVLLATPVSAHHKPGHQGGPPWTRDTSSSNDDRGDKHDDKHDDKHGESSWSDNGAEDGPPAGPGNSGAAHWCKLYYNDPDADFQFSNHGQCVSHYAHARKTERQDQDDDSVDDETEDHGDLTITNIRVRDDRTFRIRGFGAEGTVLASVSRGSDLVVAVGQAEAESDGTFTIEGTWVCQDDDSSEEVRLRVQDLDERASKNATFPCDDVDD